MTVQAVLAGVVAGVALAVLLRGALRRHGRGLGPADRVTLTRAGLSVLVLALTVQSWTGAWSAGAAAVLVGLAAVALVLDAVDGRVARRTGTVTPLGARFDLEVDAFLIAVLSLYVAPTVGWWVLLAGAARYLLLGAEKVWPWLRRPTPPRRWAKVVAAVQGVVLAVAASEVLSLTATRLLLVAALVLLAESFGHQVRTLRRLRQQGEHAPAWIATAAATSLLWLALVVPADTLRPGPGRFVRLPVELVVLVVLGLLLPRAARRTVAVVFGLLAAVLVVVKALDLGFLGVLDRPFDPLGDWGFLRSGTGVLADSVGPVAAVLVLVGVALAAVALVVVLPLAALRVTRAAADDRAGWGRGLAGLTVLALAVSLGVSLVRGSLTGPVASAAASTLAVQEVGSVVADVQDLRSFDAAIATDRYAGGADLTRLHGTDVLLVFVESYGQVAVNDSPIADRVASTLARGQRSLTAAGYGTRSAFLTSPTFGAGSWLAHSTLQSGLWVDSQLRYDRLLTRHRLTLTRAFSEQGWRTVVDVPSITRPWPEGKRFYGFDTLYDAHNVGYQGPDFAYATMPDQYTLATFARRELRGPKPVMAELDLVSSHHPWAPLPTAVPWSEVGDGSVFADMPAQGETPAEAFRSPSAVRRAYADSVAYSLQMLVDFAVRERRRPLLLVVLGDHQPHGYVTGPHPSHDVPVTVISRDPALLQRVNAWDWQPGLRPRAGAPLWRMDAFRDRFLQAFGPG